MLCNTDFGAESDCSLVPVVPADGETHGRIDITSTVLRNSTRKRQPGGHLTETLHHGEDGNTGTAVAQEDGKGTSSLESATDTQEKTSANGTTEGDELDVTGLEAGRPSMRAFRVKRKQDVPSSYVAILLSSLDVSIEICCFTNSYRALSHWHLLLFLLEARRHADGGLILVHVLRHGELSMLWQAKRS